MVSKRLLKLVHFNSTGWFVLCAGFLLVSGLRQAGVNWWLIFSLSGYSVVFLFLLVGFYLFAVFRGVLRSQKIELEHPLSTSTNYMVFYDIAPFLGGVAGFIAGMGSNRLAQHANIVATGSFVTTFLVWVVFDPAIASIEIFLPSCKEHRNKRLIEAKAAKEQQQLNNEQLLARITKEQEHNRQLWQKFLEDNAANLYELVTHYESGYIDSESKALEIGASAWRLGGIACMRRLHEMFSEIYRNESGNDWGTDLVGYWWDGIGSWRAPSVIEFNAA